MDKKIYEAATRELNQLINTNLEEAIRHNPYEQEVREVASIRNGDIELLEEAWKEDYEGKTGILADTEHRSNQNLAIVLIVLAGRAAMEGGVLPEIAHTLSDIYIRRVEKTKTAKEAMEVGRTAEYHYTLLVRDVKRQNTASETEQEDKRIKKCKDYIFAHLHEKIRLEDIAKELYMNTNYLCVLFKKKEGKSIGTFIAEEKMKLVKNMLIYSGYSHSQIAAYLGYSSQSHLGSQFKKMTGMTLEQYRLKYGKEY